VFRHRDADYVCWFEDDFFNDEELRAIDAILRNCSASLAGTLSPAK
jgi:hypothetical protein